VHEVIQLPRQFEIARRSTAPGAGRRLFRRVVHFFCYNFLLQRSRTIETRAAGFRMRVRPTVFHPRFFVTSEFFAGFIDELDLRGKQVLDIGTCSGILALAAARSGAAGVTAVDINPNAALTAADNAHGNGFGGCVRAVCSNLLSAVDPGADFDVIISNPPYFSGEPRDLADRAWHAGPGCRDIAALFEQARERLAPGGCLYLLISSDCDLDLFAAMIAQAGFRARLAARRSLLVEALLIYALEPA
jgi:methylase of polypeptide subunit release factors